MIDWYPLYRRMKDISWLLLGNPFDPPADADPMVVNAEILEFEVLIDRFFERIIEPESMDQFYTRMMKEIKNNKRKFDQLDHWINSRNYHVWNEVKV